MTSGQEKWLDIWRKANRIVHDMWAWPSEKAEARRIMDEADVKLGLAPKCHRCGGTGREPKAKAEAS